jgi:hypothetical protein
MNIGDKIRVTNTGKAYTTANRYASMACLSNYDYGHDPIKGAIYTCLNIILSDRNDTLMCLEADNGKQYLVGDEGCELASVLIDKPKDQLYLVYSKSDKKPIIVKPVKEPGFLITRKVKQVLGGDAVYSMSDIVGSEEVDLEEISKYIVRLGEEYTQHGYANEKIRDIIHKYLCGRLKKHSSAFKAYIDDHKESETKIPETQYAEIIHKPHNWETQGTYVKGMRVEVIEKGVGKTKVKFDKPVYVKCRHTCNGKTQQWRIRNSCLKFESESVPVIKVNSRYAGVEKLKEKEKDMGDWDEPSYNRGFAVVDFSHCYDECEIGDVVDVIKEGKGLGTGRITQLTYNEERPYCIEYSSCHPGLSDNIRVGNGWEIRKSKSKKKVTKKKVTKKTSNAKSEVVSKAKDIAKSVGDKNKEAATMAAEIVAGQTINSKLKEVIKPMLPTQLQELADGPFGALLISNIVSTVVEVYPDDERLNRASECLIKAAYVDGAEDLKIKDKVLSLLDGIKLPK